MAFFLSSSSKFPLGGANVHMNSPYTIMVLTVTFCTLAMFLVVNFVASSAIRNSETKMDEMTEILSPLKNFVLPGSDIANAHCHIARCICRRAERLAVGLLQHEEVDGNIIKYLNRLSDYLFTLSRYITHSKGTQEVIWEG